MKTIAVFGIVIFYGFLCRNAKSLIAIKLNGPPLKLWDAVIVADKRVTAGHHLAVKCYSVKDNSEQKYISELFFEGAQKIFINVSKGEISDPLIELQNADVISHNTTTYSVSGQGELVKALPEGAKFNFTLYLGEKKIPVRSPPRDVCEFMENNKNMQGIYDSSNIPSKCPIPLGQYHVDDATLIIKQIPSMLPPGCYTCCVHFWEKDEVQLLDILVINSTITDSKGNVRKPCIALYSRCNVQ